MNNEPDEQMHFSGIELPSDEEITIALVNGVQMAANGDTEQSVTTILTRPMWNAFLRYIRKPEDSEPTDWLGMVATNRVYGSRTIVVEGDEMKAVSFKEGV